MAFSPNAHSSGIISGRPSIDANAVRLTAAFRVDGRLYGR